MRRVIHPLFAALFLAASARLFSPATAADFRGAEDFVLKADETIEDDLYVCAKTIRIDGTVDGDVIGWAQQITVNGTVKGSLIVAGQTIVLNGSASSARLGGQVIKLGPKAKLVGDLLAGGQSLECAKESSIGGDLVFGGQQALLAGTVSDDIRGVAMNCRLEGSVGGDVHLEISGDKNAPVMNYGPQPPVPMPSVPSGLTVADSAKIEGDLIYEAKQEAKIDPQATVNGDVKFAHHTAPAKPGKKAAAAAPAPSYFSQALLRLRHLISVGLVGLVVMLLLPASTTASADMIRTRPVASFLGGLVGFGAFIAFLFVAAFVIVAAILLLVGVRLSELAPIVAVGGTVGYAAVIVGFWIVFSFLAEALTGLALGRMFVRDEGLGNRIAALVIGILIVGLLLSVPYANSLIGFLVLLFGLGAICLRMIGQTPAITAFGPAPPAKPVPATAL
jgi:cytoskeletal protein CcmA (bactofilin family)